MPPTDYDLDQLRRDFDSKFDCLKSDLNHEVEHLQTRIDDFASSGVRHRAVLRSHINELEEEFKGIREAVGKLG
jgi:hypothetical protein